MSCCFRHGSFHTLRCCVSKCPAASGVRAMGLNNGASAGSGHCVVSLHETAVGPLTSSWLILFPDFEFLGTARYQTVTPLTTLSTWPGFLCATDSPLVGPNAPSQRSSDSCKVSRRIREVRLCAHGLDGVCGRMGVRLSTD